MTTLNCPIPETMPLYHSSPLVDHDWCMVAQPDNPEAADLPQTPSSVCRTVHHRNGCQGATGERAWHPRLVTVFDPADWRCTAHACRTAAGE